MFSHHRTQGFVLKQEERGEADKLFTVFTKDSGRLLILGKGIRKMTSKLRGGIPLFSISEIGFVLGNRKTLTDSILIKEFGNFKTDLNRLEIVSKISNILDSVIKGEEEDLKIWELLNQVFEELNKKCNDSLFYYFLWNFFAILGYGPELYSCLKCKKKLEPENLWFSKGGVVCEGCKDNSIAIDPNTIKILREILKKDLERFLNLKIRKDFEKDLKRISYFYLDFLVD